MNYANGVESSDFTGSRQIARCMRGSMGSAAAKTYSSNPANIAN
jgi:hypothetical protein